MIEHVLNVDSGSKIVEPIVANHGETKDTRYLFARDSRA